MYTEEILDDYEDDGTMPANVTELSQAVVGHKIISAGNVEVPSGWGVDQTVFQIELDNGKKVQLAPGGDCCAYTALEQFLLHPDKVDHMIMGVGTTEEYTTWHIYADWGDVLELTVGWSAGNVGYYGYGFDINVVDVDGDSNDTEI